LGRKLIEIMLKSSRKKLIVSGDSFTAGSNYRTPGDGSIKNNQTYIWPDILAEKLDMECVNLGEGGTGNEKIHNEMFDELCHPKDIGLAICMWSSFDRWDFYGLSFRLYVQKHFDLLSKMRKSLRYFHSFQTQCEHKNVDYLQVQGFYPTESLIKGYLDIPHFDCINSKTFLGWPIYEELGGYQISTKLRELDPDQTELHISEVDSHPNDKGHAWIADFFYETYKELY
tara:strand:- start:337 stop:1020 length:684 start_codon:yes stop_codon:yes gene_type:complete